MPGALEWLCRDYQIIDKCLSKLVVSKVLPSKEVIGAESGRDMGIAPDFAEISRCAM